MSDSRLINIHRAGAGQDFVTGISARNLMQHFLNKVHLTS